MAGTFAMATGCTKAPPPLDAAKLREFASDYAVAWSSQDPARVAACFANNGSLTINGGAPLVGREAIAARAKQYMTDFPDLLVKMEELSLFEGEITFHWAMSGKNRGPGGTGKAVDIRGYEEWTLAPDGLISASKGHYDEDEYQRQLREGVMRTR
jgi:uncharacterized protein (TIGR02246 family)